MRACVRVCVILWILQLCAECMAGAPGIMSYQGRLTGSSGQPMGDGSYGMVFSLFTQETGGTASWTESQSVQVTGGIFSVLLGSVTEIPASAFQGATWLETQVDGSVLSPRTRIVSAGYAMSARTAETVPDGAITAQKLATGAVGSSAILDGSIFTQDLADQSVTTGKLKDNSVIASKIFPGNVVSSHLADLAVTTNKLAWNAVTTGKIAPGAVTASKLSGDIRWQITASVTEHGAAGDGVTDDTAAFQAALDAVAADGGGIVWVPTGTYRISTNIVIPTRVTLEGVFRSPQGNYTGNYGSTLLAYAGRGNENGTPFIQMGVNSVVKGINVVYPEQSNTAPVPYPWCIRGSGDNCSIIDVLLVNPWNAIDFGTNPCGRHLILRVYGQPLHTGIFVNQCYDVGRIQDVHFWPFWTEALVAYTQQNATGIKLGRTDWEYVTNCFVLGYKIGYHFVRTEQGNCNGTFLGIGSDGSGIAVRVDSAAPYGLLITNGEFVANAASDSVGMYVGTDGGSVSLTNCAFWGASHRISTIDGGSVKFNSCNFMDWDRNGTGEYGIVANGGRLTVQGCSFVDSKNRVRVASGVTAAIVVGNQGMNNTDVSNSIGTRCSVANNQR